MTTNEDRVREFHETFGHPAPPCPVRPQPQLAQLRFRLIVEELREWVEVQVNDNRGHRELVRSVFRQLEEIVGQCIEPDVHYDRVATADAVADLLYVVEGAGIAYGFPTTRLVAEVHRSNMSKIGPNGEPLYDAGGKVLKGPDYRPPDIKRVLLEGREE